MNTIIILGIVCLSLSIAIYIFVGRRKFNRRNQSGIETFSSYSKSAITRFGEGFLKLLALALFLAGTGLMGLWYYGSTHWNHSAQKSKWKILEHGAMCWKQLRHLLNAKTIAKHSGLGTAETLLVFLLKFRLRKIRCLTVSLSFHQLYSEMIEPEKLPKLIERMKCLVTSLDDRNDLVIHQHVNLFFYMQKIEELKTLSGQIQEVRKTLESLTCRVEENYHNCFTQWRKDARWLNSYLAREKMEVDTLRLKYFFFVIKFCLYIGSSRSTYSWPIPSFRFQRYRI